MTSWSMGLQRALADHVFPGQLGIDDAAVEAPEVSKGVLSPKSHCSDRPSKSVLVPDRTLLDAAKAARAEQAGSRARFVAAVWAAADAGFSNCRIASEVGMTEAGIRLLLKRSKYPS